MPSISRLVVVVCAASACTGDIFPGGFMPGSPFGPGSGGEGGGAGSGAGAGQEAPIVVGMTAPQVRALSATEYRATVRDLLGLAVQTPLSQADWAAGFDNGANIHVDDNLLSALLDESERLGAEYVATRARADFACFDPGNVTDACMRELIAKLGRRAHRRPLTAEQRDELFAFFEGVSSAVNDRRTGAQLVVARLVMAPQFLYRSEVGRPTTPTGDLYALDDFERASVVSYTLTGTMPDEALLADAEAGRLDEAGLRRHIKRLWGSPNARARVGDFFRQWLKLTRVDHMAQRPTDYPKLTSPSLGASLKAELDAFVAAVVFDGPGTLPALFTESFTIADANTAPLYGLTATAPTRLQLDPTQRKGVLTLASSMAAIGKADDAARDRPVLRGLMVKEQLLCEEVGPPSNVNTAAAAATAQSLPNFDQLTTREQYEAMMQQGAECRGCHRQFMPMGFTLGKYDALGRYRTVHNGRAVDSVVTDVPFGGGKPRSFGGGVELAEAVAASPRTASCFSQNFVSFATGAAHTEHTDSLSASLVQKAGSGPLDLARFVEEALVSPSLYLRKGVPYVAPMTGGAGGGSGG
ncbi:MAG: DUF1592 domain-containing protein, partial [Myxococcaceae bacterium]|nr:DUF1592 domain-containing protein [Myxococcaceae bacterium]